MQFLPAFPVFLAVSLPSRNPAQYRLLERNMTIATLTEGPAVLVGYEYRLQLEAEGALFPDEARFAGQVRRNVNAETVLATLTSESGTILRRGDSRLELIIPETVTAELTPGSVVLDLVRSDLVPPQHLNVFLEIPVLLPVTRGL
jgi:hypothetical protein